MKRMHQTPTKFRQDIHAITITLVGVGGTGSFLLPRLARLHLLLKDLGRKGLFVNAYDDKIVKEHLVGRQNFTYADVGEYKSVCTIDKINKGLGLNWMAHIDRYPPILKGNIFITCVDDAKYRMNLRREYDSADRSVNYYWLDCGNGKDFGQIILGSKEIPQPKDTDIFAFNSDLEYVTELYPNLLDFEDDENQGSCSFRETINQQGLFTNDLIAGEAALLLQDLLKDNLIDYHAKFVNLKDGTASKKYL